MNYAYAPAGSPHKSALASRHGVCDITDNSNGKIYGLRTDLLRVCVTAGRKILQGGCGQKPGLK
jgi:hypothetical protein